MANRPEAALLDFEVHSSRPIQKLNTVTTIITSSTISTISTSTTTTSTSIGGTVGAVGRERTSPALTSNPRNGWAAEEEAGGGVKNGKLDGSKRKGTTCACTNIGIMQLFYEMKQKFPTVSDNVVNECVVDNCHNRTACIERLKEIVAGSTNAGLVQAAYPAKSLWQAATPSPDLLQDQSPKRDLKSDCDTNNMVVKKNDQGVLGFRFIKNQPPPQPPATTPHPTPPSSTIQQQINNISLNNNTNLRNNNSDKTPTTATSVVNDASDSNRNIGNSSENSEVPPQLQRPTTLNFRETSGNRPFRSAPPIPSVTSSTSSLSSLSVISNFADPEPPSSLVSGSNESINVSVNVTLSPVLPQRNKPPIRPPRHTTAITVQPELNPFASVAPSSPRSFTSVNLTLRPPGEPEAVTSPIDIRSSGSSLTYSSSSYDAKHGYQSMLKITVGNEVSISTTRTRSPSFPQPPQQQPPQMPMVVTSSIQNSFRNNVPDPGRPSVPTIEANRPGSYSEADVVHRQLMCKGKLSIELENDRKRLDTMKREIRVLEEPVPIGAAERLQYDIETLRAECEKMAMAVEEAGPFVLGETNAAFYENIYTGQRLPSQQIRPQKPPRPPPPSIPRNSSYSSVSGGGGAQAVNPGPSTRFEAAAASDPDLEANYSDGPPWTCTVCTFQNHPLLDKCEECSMPRISGYSGHQQQQQHQQAGIVQITSSQYIPARSPNNNPPLLRNAPAIPTPPQGGDAAALPCFSNMSNSADGQSIMTPMPYPSSFLTSYTNSPLVYSAPVCQVPFQYPPNMMPTPSSSSSIMSFRKNSQTSTTTRKSPTGKRVNLNTKISQSISNLFSGNSGSSSSNSNNNSSESPSLSGPAASSSKTHKHTPSF